MGLGVLRIGIMHVVRCHKRDIQFFAHTKKHGIYRLLSGNPVIL